MMTSRKDLTEAARRAIREAYVAVLREGRKQRSNQFRAKRGPGSYNRKNRRKDWDD